MCCTRSAPGPTTPCNPCERVVVMRTKDVRTGTLLGGMRGDRSGELQLIAPTPTLTTVLAVNLTRLTARLVRAAAKHPLALAVLVALAGVWVLVGWPGVLALLLAAGAGLPAWWRCSPETYRLVVVARWRHVCVYGRWWQPAMVTCGLALEVNGREYLPKIRKVHTRPGVDLADLGQVLPTVHLQGQPTGDHRRLPPPPIDPDLTPTRNHHPAIRLRAAPPPRRQAGTCGQEQRQHPRPADQHPDAG